MTLTSKRSEPFYMRRLRFHSEREAYSRLTAAMAAGSVTVDVSDLRLTGEMLHDVGEAIRLDNPMLFHCRIDSWFHIDGIATHVVIAQRYSDAARMSMTRAIEDALSDAYYGYLREAGDPVTAERMVLRWLRDNTIYDLKEAGSRVPEHEYRSVVGTMVHRRGVCSSISMAASLMLNACGFSATCVTGRSQGGSHMWNAVRTPYGWVHSDFTFALGSGDVTYLDMDDRSCGVDHQWDIDIGGIWADLRGRPRSLSSNCASWRAR